MRINIVKCLNGPTLMGHSGPTRHHSLAHGVTSNTKIELSPLELLVRRNPQTLRTIAGSQVIHKNFTVRPN